MDQVMLARIQFGVTTIYHFFFVPLTIGLVFLVALMETLYVMKKNEVYNASSGAYSLKIMTFVALTILPFVLGNTIWSYYIFRKRVTDKDHLTY